MSLDLIIVRVLNESFEDNVKSIIKEKTRGSNLKDNKYSYLANLTVRYYFCNKYNIANEDLVFSTKLEGKPILLNKNCFFNISHTTNAIVIACSDENVGVDIERIKNIDIDLLVNHLNNDEKEYIISSSRQKNAFFEVWTKKESYLKYLGVGFNTCISSFSVLALNNSVQISSIEYDNYLISYCTKTHQNNINIEFLNESQVMDFAVNAL